MLIDQQAFGVGNSMAIDVVVERATQATIEQVRQLMWAELERFGKGAQAELIALPQALLVHHRLQPADQRL